MKLVFATLFAAAGLFVLFLIYCLVMWVIDWFFPPGVHR